MLAYQIFVDADEQTARHLVAALRFTPLSGLLPTDTAKGS